MTQPHVPSNNDAIERAASVPQWAHNAKRLRELAEQAERGHVWSPDTADRAAALARTVYASMLVQVWQTYKQARDFSASGEHGKPAP